MTSVSSPVSVRTRGVKSSSSAVSGCSFMLKSLQGSTTPTRESAVSHTYPSLQHHCFSWQTCDLHTAGFGAFWSKAAFIYLIQKGSCAIQGLRTDSVKMSNQSAPASQPAIRTVASLTATNWLQFGLCSGPSFCTSSKIHLKVQSGHFTSDGHRVLRV